MSEEINDPSAGELVLGVAANGDLRWAVADLAGPLEEARRRLDLSPLSSVALGRSLAAAVLLLRFSTKTPGRLTFEVRGDGPLGKIVAEVDDQGSMRGLVGEPRLPNPDDGRLAIGPAVGGGLLEVTRESKRGRYSSRVELHSGEIGDDLVHFLEQSQQIRSAALLGVLPCPNGIAAAGGLLIEAFPGVPEETLVHLEANIGALGAPSDALDEGGVEALLDRALEGFDREELERHPLAYRCRCSAERLLGALATLPSQDLDSITDQHGQVAAVCSFCGQTYSFDRGQLAVQ